MKFNRHYTTTNWDPTESIGWVTRTAEIPGSGFKLEGVRAPASWSQDAVNIVASKYFRREETDVEDLVHRVADTIADFDLRYFDTDEDVDNGLIFIDELEYLLLNQHAAFNSPVWFNVGVEEKPQCSACFILSVEDNINSILEWYRNEGLIFKGGSGAGVNLSKLRGSMEPLSTSGTASGPVSFMRGADSIAGAVKSGGKTRRAAKMVILDDDHPDLREFIQCKVKEERKAKALAREGYDLGLNGEAWSSVQFQNANNSVRVGDDFMEAAIAGGEWGLTYREEGQTSSEKWGDGVVVDNASNLLNLIAKAAWECGDPGIQFKDTINRMHTRPKAGEIRASNPCSEFLSLDKTACNLASINLAKYWKNGQFDIEGFKHTVHILITAMDILVDMSSYPTEEIAQNAHRYRELGLGYTNLATMLFMAGMPYGSEEGRDLAASITALMNAQAYATSIELGVKLGAAEGLEEWGTRGVWERHLDSLEDYTRSSIWNEAFEVCPFAVDLSFIRNTQLTLLAPTGTISFMMDCDSTGIEPIYAPNKVKTLVGGGSMTTIPECWPNSLSYDERFYNPLFTTAMGNPDGSNRVSIEDHLLMMAAVQPHLSGGISKTVNVPEETTPQQIRELFIRAWELGLKSISVYRDNSKTTQIMSTLIEGDFVGVDSPDDSRYIGPQENTPDEIEEMDKLVASYLAVPSSTRKKLPTTRDAILHKFEIGGQDGYFTVGLYPDGTPGELFITISKEGSTLGGLMDSFAVMVSLALQYGVPLADIARKLKGQRFEPAGFTGDKNIPSCTSVVDYIFQWMEKRFLFAPLWNIPKPGEPWPVSTNVNVLKPEWTMGGYVDDTKALDEWATRIWKATGGMAVRDEAPSVSIPLPTTHGMLCPNCGGIMSRSGSCFVCGTCGEATGCG